MNIESIEVSSERIPPIGTDMAGSSKVTAGVLFFVAVIFGISVLFGAGDEADKASDSAEKAGEIIGALVAIAIPGLIGMRFARNASRANRAAQLAATDSRYAWRLSGKFIIAADAHGAPRPELSFKINRKLRTMLLAVPRATVVD
jgi:hypothetical protein